MKLNWINIVKTGFFSERLPLKIFTTIDVTQYLLTPDFRQLESDLKSGKILSTPCLILSSFKNKLERRFISIPHIETYLLLSEHIENLSSEIELKIKLSPFSQSKKINPNEIINYTLPSFFEKNYKERILKSMGFKYMLEMDISKCYDNIYTHSVTWAFLGKEVAKEEFNKENKLRSDDYKKIDELDKKLMAINNNETKGIPTGPITSRIISELVLCELDDIIKKELVTGVRFVDDYKFFFKTKQEAESFIPKLQNILYQYKLSINNEKTKIFEYPYEYGHNLRFELGNFDFKKYSTISFINRCNELYVNGNKGAYKYGLKVLERQVINVNEKEYVLSQLLSIMTIHPIMSELVLNIFKNNYGGHFKEQHFKIFNELLKDNLKIKYDVEIIWLITIMMSLKIEIDLENILRIFENYETFSLILILDYINVMKLYSNDNIKEKKEKLKESLQKESIYGEKWLLLYECNLNNWVKGIKVNLNKSKFLLNLYNNKIKFYFSPL